MIRPQDAIHVTPHALAAKTLPGIVLLALMVIINLVVIFLGNVPLANLIVTLTKIIYFSIAMVLLVPIVLPGIAPNAIRNIIQYKMKIQYSVMVLHQQVMF